jgi:hypothetical protein
MATIPLDIPDAQLSRVLDTLAARGGWSATTGLTKQQFAKRAIADLVKMTVVQFEQEQGRAAVTVQAPPDIT